MDYLHTIVLGVVQGLSEFLPISSSAHLIITPWLMGWKDNGLVLDVALHIGTLFSVLLYYRETWARLAISLISIKEETKTDRKLFGQLVVATIPGVIIGLLGKDYAETAFRSPLLIAGTLSVMGMILWLADQYWSKKKRKLSSLSWKDCILIGISQGFAIVPGFSRSGTTITAGLILGFRREEAAKFSFLLSAPIIAGAAVLQVPEILEKKLYSDSAFWLGIGTAGLVGYLAISFLLKFVSKRSYLPFAIYRLLMGALIVLVWLIRRAS